MAARNIAYGEADGWSPAVPKWLPAVSAWAVSARLARPPLATTSRPVPAVRGTGSRRLVLSDGSGALVLEELEHAQPAARDLCRAGWLRHERRRFPMTALPGRRRRCRPLHEERAARCRPGSSSGRLHQRPWHLHPGRRHRRDRRGEERVRRACPCAVDEFDQSMTGHLLGAAGAGGGDLQRAGPARPGVAPPTINPVTRKKVATSTWWPTEASRARSTWPCRTRSVSAGPTAPWCSGGSPTDAGLVDASAEPSVRDRGLAYGDGLFETLAVRRHAAFLSATWRAWKRGVDASRSSRRRSVAPGVAGVLRGAGRWCRQADRHPRRGFAWLRAACRGLAAANPLRIAASGLSRAPLAEGVRLFACRTRLAEQPLLAGLSTSTA